ncbi:hypothetical protein Back2_27450 [Nocardioides baekrokdamisoli]|uniref:Phosphoesterase n=1 Tax=Nocardioides baekrokdamisoli TaxID=1804624 RepID=A0A3G9J495_9ACTN|nr:alkaline phosphatase family protein [Nocardioides baekrokdamisoli]BBH18458.1 hypothetical protein Back2_27450 [Nocardioides baekrokdamisoli]
MIRRLIPGAAAAVVAAGLLVISSPAAPPALAAVSGNLIVNPGAESGECSVNGLQGETLPGWTITNGMPTNVCYGTAGGFPTSTTPGAPSRGNTFFAGGGTGNATMEQSVDVSSAATAIDAGGVTYNLSGWLGGWSSQNDTAGVQATFLNASGTSVGTAQLAAVTASDRGNTTEFLQRTATAAVPAGTRTVRVDVNYVWSGGSTTDGYVDNLSLTLSTTVTQPTLSAPASSVPGFDHVFLIYMENENGFQQSVDGNNYIYGNAAAPYINNTLVPMGTRLNNLYGTTHPSDPNYLALAGGSVSGQTSNPAVGSVNATNLADRAEAAGKTWKAYNQGANGTCDLTTHGSTYPDDEPFTLYNDVANNSTRCNSHIMPLTQLSTDLSSASTTPNFSWIAADDYYDMEAGGIAPGDTWLSQTLPTIFNSPAWKTQRSLLIVTWDEGYTKSYGPNYPNEVAGVMIGSPGTVKAGATSTTRYNQYSIGRTIENALGLSPMTPNDTYAQPINDVWGQSTSPTLSTTTPSVTNGSSITFNYTTPAATNSSTNWVGIYKQGNTPGNQASTDWKYTAGTSGSVTFTANYGPGTYQVYYLYNDGYTVLAGPITVTLN